MAAILLEPLFAPAAATAAARQHRSHRHPSSCKPSHLQPHWYLRPTHSRTPHTSGPPPSPIHDAAATHATTTDSTIPAGIPTPTTPTTAHSRSSHSTAIDLQTQSTISSGCPRRHCASPTAPRPFPHATTPRLLEPNRSPLGCQHTARPPALPHHTTYTMVS